MRRCNIPPSTCRHKYAAPCCKDCQEADCSVRCQNAPEQCGCWSDKPPRQKRERRVDTLQIAWLHGQGLTQAQVARWLGCSRQTVGNVLREMGVSRFDQS